jgi:hypothetical protein
MKACIFLLACMLLALLLAAGCAPSPDQLAATEGNAAGFFKGLWHGFILLFTFIISIFSDSVGIYESHNNGTWYNLGFVLGVMIFFGCSGGGACKKAKCS